MNVRILYVLVCILVKNSFVLAAGFFRGLAAILNIS